MVQLMENFSNEIEWFQSLERAEKMGVSAFWFCCLMVLATVICLIVSLLKKKSRPKINLDFKLEDAAFQSFRKKGFVTFDLYVQNIGRKAVEISRVGVVMADGSEKAIFQEPHVLKTPDKAALQPGEEAFYDDCDLYYCLNERPPYYKKIIGLFVDVKGYPRFIQKHDIPALLNDQTIRATLTDQKGVNGF